MGRRRREREGDRKERRNSGPMSVTDVSDRQQSMRAVQRDDRETRRMSGGASV